MNKLKGSLLITAMMLVGGASLLAVSCGDKNSIVYTFETNGGGSVESVTLKPGDEYTLPDPPLREGYRFQGWYTNPEFSGESVKEVSAEQSCTYYAKWEQLYFVTLDVQGGTLTPALEGFYLGEGENLGAAMNAYVPELSGCEFAGWYLGDEEISEEQTMSASAVTLTARYTVGYTVEIYKESADGSGYQKEDQTVSGKGYVGISCSPDVTVEGFVRAEKAEGSVETKVLSSVASENVFRLYFDRAEYTVSFHSNYPAGMGAEEVREQSVIYGTAIELLPDFYTAEGYMLLGWAKTPGGEIAYSTDFSAMLANDPDHYPVQPFLPSENLDLYAVWSEGCLDLMGGGDRIYPAGKDTGVIYLYRNGILLWGEYDAEAGKFTFYDEKEDILLEGKMYGDGLYVYYDENRDGTVSTLFEVTVGLVETTKIYFDAYNGITYAEQDETTGMTSQSVGSYVLDEEGLYVVTFDSGNLRGQTMTLLVGTVEISGVRHSAFQIRNDEEYELGRLVRYVVNGGSVSYFTSSYMLELNGFGIATYNAGTTSAANYYYTVDGEKITLMYSNGSVFGVVCVVDDFSLPGYMVYDETFDRMCIADSGATLEMDGLCKATFTDGKDLIVGYYAVQESVLGGYIIKVYDASGTGAYRTCYLKTIEETSGEAGGETQTTVRYVLEVKLNSYAEYRYLGETGVSKAPLIILDEVQAGRATLYGYTGKEYVKVSEGSYTYDQATGKYLYTVDGEALSPEGVQTTPFDLTAVKSVVFGLGKSGSSAVSYWYSVTTDEGTDNYDVQYSAQSGEATLTLVGGFALYRADGQVYAGTFSKNDSGLLAISTDTGYLYFQLDTENHSFLKLVSAPITAVLLGQDGQTDSSRTLVTDGKGGGKYIESPEDGEEVTVEGIVSETSRVTFSGAVIYHFESAELSFDFLYLSSSTAVYFARYNEEANGEYSAADGGTLVLDGFAYMASYTDSDSVVHEGNYALMEDGTVYLRVDSTEYFYFDLSQRAFTVRGEEYGTYLVLDNHTDNGLYLEMDGYGKLSVYRTEQKEDGSYDKIYVDQQGTYRRVNGLWEIRYSEDNAQYTVTGELDTIVSGNYLISVFFIARTEVVTSYLDREDWSVLYLDGHGNAVLYDNMGRMEEGSYLLITETLLYYVNESGSEACIYTYDKEAGTIVKSDFTARGYYTKDLESMIFREYGFMTFNGETRYYYNVEADGSVFIYRQDPTNPEANVYGFVTEEDFGEFTDVKEFDGKTYYANSGFALTFSRQETGKNNYPVTVDGESKLLESLTFIPGGGLEFSVVGVVTIGGSQYECNVVREQTESGALEMYVGVGYYRFYISVSYTGEQGSEASPNTFDIVDMKLVVQVPSYTYYTLYYLYYVFYQTIVPNTIGEITLVMQYDQDGLVTEEYIMANFGADSGMYDSTGAGIPVPEKVAYITEESGLYLVEFIGEDGYTYRMHFSMRTNNLVGALGYYVYALTRVETIDAGNGYTVETERCLYSDAGYSQGDYWSVSLYKEEEELDADVILIIEGTLYYVVRETDADGKILSTVYYEISLTENEPVSVEEGESVPLPTFASATVEMMNMVTVYDATGEAYIDRDETGAIWLVWFEGEVHIVAESTGDETSGYTLKTNTGRTFSVRFSNGVALIVDVTESQSAE